MDSYIRIFSEMMIDLLAKLTKKKAQLDAAHQGETRPFVRLVAGRVEAALDDWLTAAIGPLAHGTQHCAGLHSTAQ